MAGFLRQLNKQYPLSPDAANVIVVIWDLHGAEPEVGVMTTGPHPAWPLRTITPMDDIGLYLKHCID